MYICRVGRGEWVGVEVVWHLQITLTATLRSHPRCLLVHSRVGSQDARDKITKPPTIMSSSPPPDPHFCDVPFEILFYSYLWYFFMCWFCRQYYPKLIYQKDTDFFRFLRFYFCFSNWTHPVNYLFPFRFPLQVIKYYTARSDFYSCLLYTSRCV